MKSILYVVFQLVTRSWLLLDQLIYGKIWYSQAWHKAFVLRVKMNCSLDNVRDALPSHGGETHLRVSQSQVAELRLGSTLMASNSRKG